MLGILVVYLITPTATAQAPIAEEPIYRYASQTALVAPSQPLERPADLQGLIAQIAREKGVNAEVMTAVIKCESSFNPNAVGDKGNSFGLSQIHLPSWGGKITKAQALDPEFAISFMADRLAEGKGSLWTCYRKLY